MTLTTPPDPFQDGHVHTLYSDGTASVEQMVQAAIDSGLSAVAITDHMPLPVPRRYTMAIERLPSYRREVRTVQTDYRDRIRVYLGLEMEYLPSEAAWCRDIAAMGWDRRIGSVHRIKVKNDVFLVNGNRAEFDQALGHGFDGRIRRLVEAYFDALGDLVASGLFDVVGHLDVVKKHLIEHTDFREDLPWYQARVRSSLDAIAAAGMAVEINASGLYQPPRAPYPSEWIVAGCRRHAISLVFGSDAHRPDRVGRGFGRAMTPMVDQPPESPRA